MRSSDVTLRAPDDGGVRPDGSGRGRRTGGGAGDALPPLAAVANAVYDATGHRLTDLPMSPIRVLDALLSGPD